MTGFQTFKATGIEVGTNQVVRRDAALQVGVMSETITVAAGAVLLATENATLVETINERAVEELPLSGRNVWSLAGTTPGVLGGTSSFTGAGQRNIQNSLSMDGINTAARREDHLLRRWVYSVHVGDRVDLQQLAWRGEARAAEIRSDRARLRHLRVVDLVHRLPGAVGIDERHLHLE